jgi:hypothetical protein
LLGFPELPVCDPIGKCAIFKILQQLDAILKLGFGGEQCARVDYIQKMLQAPQKGALKNGTF